MLPSSKPPYHDLKSNMKPRDFGLEHLFIYVFHEFPCPMRFKVMGVALSHPVKNQISTINHPAIAVFPLMETHTNIFPIGAQIP